MRRAATFIGIAVVYCSLGCAQPPDLRDLEIGPEIGSDAAALTGLNKLALNKLALNKLALNKLALNKLALNKLALNKLALNGISGLHETADGREVLEYAVRCALDQADTLVVEYDGITYEFPGSLGLAPEWVDEPLSASQSRMMSACLLAHVNAYAVSVPISLRAAGALAFDEQERRDYPVFEGAFFGEVITGGAMYACQGHAPEIARQQSTARGLRACTDPTPDCGIVSVGRCRDVCESFTPGFGWHECRAGGQVYEETINAWLARDGALAADATCEAGGDCSLKCTGQDRAGTLDCAGSEGHECATRCDDGSACSVECSPDDDSCRSRCDHGSTCELNCVEAQDCSARCAGGSTCEIDCLRANECHEVACVDGAECMLRCTDAVTCGFQACTGGSGEQSCAGGVVVCNRPCP